MSSAYLFQANLSAAKLDGSCFQATRLPDANLLMTSFVEANLEDAQLEHANLMGAVLDNADLSGASFAGALLKDVSMKGANLSGTNFVNSSSSIFPELESRVIPAIGLTQVQLDAACADVPPILPSSLNPPSATCRSLKAGLSMAKIRTCEPISQHTE